MMISQGLAVFQGQLTGTADNLLMAGSLIAVVRVLIVAMFAQRKVAEGLALGAIRLMEPGRGYRRLRGMRLSSRSRVTALAVAAAALATGAAGCASAAAPGVLVAARCAPSGRRFRHAGDDVRAG